MKNFAGRGICYPLRPKAKVDNTLRDLQNSSYTTKAEFSNCFIIHLKYFKTLKHPPTIDIVPRFSRSVIQYSLQRAVLLTSMVQ